MDGEIEVDVGHWVKCWMVEVEVIQSELPNAGRVEMESGRDLSGFRLKICLMLDSLSLVKKR